jgi:hypothetical protein
MNNLKYFKIVNLGETSYEWGPSRQSILEDLQRMQILDKDTIVEEVDPHNLEQGPIHNSPIPKTNSTPSEETVPKFFNLANGQKLKELNGVMYSLEWQTVSKDALLTRIKCEDIDLSNEEISNIKILDWIELKPEGDENAGKTDSDV